MGRYSTAVDGYSTVGEAGRIKEDSGRAGEQVERIGEDRSGRGECSSLWHLSLTPLFFFVCLSSAVQIHFDNLSQALHTTGYEVMRSLREYAVFDSAVELDSGWIDHTASNTKAPQPPLDVQVKQVCSSLVSLRSHPLSCSGVAA